MTQSDAYKQSANTYFIEAENSAEMARLIDQDRIATKAMGGLFSEQEDLSTIVDVLDIACGPGGWVLDVAHQYPDMEVTGIDVSRIMIEYASTYARVRQLSNAHFQVMNALEPLQFPDASFDLVNARTIAGFVFPSVWPHLLAECKRILRPGGVIRLTEPEWGFANKSAFETYCALVNRALFLSGRSFSPTGRHIGINPMLKHFLVDAGFSSVDIKAHVLDYSAGATAHHSMYEDCAIGFKLLQPFMVSSGVGTQEELESLYDQAMNEMHLEDFYGILYLLTAWGVSG
jgi:ubiquinone/menaquinone biosynthesis C-methylase UbiE